MTTFWEHGTVNVVKDLKNQFRCRFATSYEQSTCSRVEASSLDAMCKSSQWESTALSILYSYPSGCSLPMNLCDFSAPPTPPPSPPSQPSQPAAAGPVSGETIKAFHCRFLSPFLTLSGQHQWKLNWPCVRRLSKCGVTVKQTHTLYMYTSWTNELSNQPWFIDENTDSESFVSYIYIHI